MQKQSIRKVYPRSVLSPREGIFIPREGIYFSPLVTNDMSVINKNTSVLMNNMPLLMNKVPLLMNKVPLLMNKVPLLHHLQFVFRTFSCIESWRMPLMSLFLHRLSETVPIPAFQKRTTYRQIKDYKVDVPFRQVYMLSIRLQQLQIQVLRDKQSNKQKNSLD